MTTVTVKQNNFNGGELSPLMAARTDQSRYGNGCRKMRNFIALPHGPAARRPGLQFIGECRDSSDKVRLIPFSFNTEQTYVLEFGHFYIRVWTKGGLVLNLIKCPVAVRSPWPSSALHKLSVCQSADMLFVACADYLPYRICRESHDNWYIAEFTQKCSMTAPTALTAEVKGTPEREYSYVVTATDTLTGEESQPSKAITFKGPQTIAIDAAVTLTWDSDNSGAVYSIYKCWNESGKYGFVGQAFERKWIDRGETPDFSKGYPIQRTVFQKKNHYPSLVQFYQQRLCFAATNNDPQTIWMSRSGSYRNFDVSDPLRDDDSISVTLAAEQVNKIEWMLPCRQLLIGTAGSEWSLSGSDGRAVTPSSLKFERQSAIGGHYIAPLVVGENILFLQKGGKVIREFQYSVQKDGYITAEISILSEHLLKNNPIVSWAYQQEPYSIIWCVLADGSLAAVTYEREHAVIGWHRHDTDGTFESVCTIKGEKGDELWCVIIRTVNGEKKRYIERLAPYSPEESSNQFFVDSGISYHGEKRDTFSGLEHLEGETVHILADGYVVEPQVVKQGKITLPFAAATVHAGLRFISEITPTEPDIALQTGSAQGRTRRISRLNLQLHETAGIDVVTGDNAPQPVVLSERSGLDLPPELFSGEKVLEVNSGYEQQAVVTLCQKNPLPVTLLSYSMQLELGER